MEPPAKVAIVGSGIIGSCWAALFASAGFKVCLYDISEEQLVKAKQHVQQHLKQLAEEGLSRGSLSAEDAFSNITSTIDLSEALNDAIYAQESAFESLEFKKKIFASMDQVASPTCILASSTSAVPASTFTEDLAHRNRCVVSHPVNPPLYLPLVEVVPAPWTSSDTIERTCAILKRIGQKPVRLNREIGGFAVNRLQYALLSEAWRLIGDDVISVEDLDTVMSAGLGPRYAFYGPLETIHMNAYGVEDYSKRYSAAMREVTGTFGAMPRFDEADVVEKLKSALNKTIPLEKLEEAKNERQQRLAALLRLKNNSLH